VTKPQPQLYFVAASILVPLLMNGCSTASTSKGERKTEGDLALKFHCAELGRHELEREEDDRRRAGDTLLGESRFGYTAALNTCVYLGTFTGGKFSEHFILDLLTGEEISSFSRTFTSSTPSKAESEAEAHFEVIQHRLFGDGDAALLRNPAGVKP
jgi:hypothetical protein